MAHTAAPINRIKVFNRKKLLEIRIPTKKNTRALIVMIIAAMSWVFALLMLVRVALSLHYFWYKAGIIFAISGWFFLGMAGASFFIWLFFGRERIIVTPHFLITDKPLVFFYRRNFYDLASISNIRTDKELYKANRNGQWIDESRTVIKFDTLEKLVTMARGVNEVEAEAIVLELAKSDFLKKDQFAVEHKF
ncbi:MAG TPA: hypothetical protein PLZ64_00510 [Chitinophagales bacterium]|nr:hypothetical protein [Chitinophagales bacterium]